MFNAIHYNLIQYNAMFPLLTLVSPIHVHVPVYHMIL